MMAFGRVAAVPWLGPKEGDEREREREWDEWRNEAQFGSGLTWRPRAKMRGEKGAEPEGEKRSIPVRVPDRGGGSNLEARIGVILRGVITTTLMVTRVATPIPGVPLGQLRVSMRCSCDLLCCIHASSPVSARWSYEAVARLSHRSNYSVRLSQEYSQRLGLGN
jgi:hypothetical protein